MSYNKIFLFFFRTFIRLVYRSENQKSTSACSAKPSQTEITRGHVQCNEIIFNIYREYAKIKRAILNRL